MDSVLLSARIVPSGSVEVTCQPDPELAASVTPGALGDVLQVVPFVPFRKIPRLKRDCLITEKLDGSNGVVYIDDDGAIWAGSHHRWLSPGKLTDNFGFAQWVEDNKQELAKLGAGHHYGEWFGRGIQRGYGLAERRFALFNTTRWAHNPDRPVCCEVVPSLFEGPFSVDAVDDALALLNHDGSQAVPGWKPAEGVVVFHKASGQLYKVTLGGDGHKLAKAEVAGG